jgi:trans-aconitate methyltransferase
MTTVQITISDALAKEAAAEGLLEPGSIEAILRERLAAARIAKMQAAREKLTAAATLPMTAEEIEADIKAYRAERRRAAGA